MITVSAGRFRMGDDGPDAIANERPAHWVDIPRGFAIGQFEITVAQFRSFVTATGYRTVAETAGGCRAFRSDWSFKADANWTNPFFDQTDSHPVVCVAYADALAYTDWLRGETGKKYRLPTEAEWEYVARAGTTSRYWWGAEPHCADANCNDNTVVEWLTRQTEPVGRYRANPFGVFDTAGNVWEWTASLYREPYDGAESRGIYEPGNRDHAIRGGSWYNQARFMSSTMRSSIGTEEPWSTVGFRVVKEPDE